MIEENLSSIGQKVKIISPKNSFALGQETHNKCIINDLHNSVVSLIKHNVLLHHLDPDFLRHLLWVRTYIISNLKKKYLPSIYPK